MAEAIVDVKELAQAIKAAVEETAPIKQVHISRYSAVTPFNPTGKKVRTKLNCNFTQNGARVNIARLTDEELELINKLKPGRFFERRVEVVERIENGERDIDIRYNNATNEQRMENKNLFRNLRELLQGCVDQQKPVKA